MVNKTSIPVNTKGIALNLLKFYKSFKSAQAPFFSVMELVMNPYNRFSLVSSSVTAALILTIVAVTGPSIFNTVQQFDGSSVELSLMLGGAVTVLVVFWMAFTEVILPSLFRLNWVRKTILGRYYFEGTWLQAEKGGDDSHIAVIDIQPDGKAFTFSGYALDENFDVNSNVLLELSKFDWPFLTYTYRNSLSDGADGRRDGVGEIQFEMNRAAARRYNGFSQYIKSDKRVRLEGTKLMRNADVKRLRTLEGRETIVDKYWELFFGREERRKEKVQLASEMAVAETPKTVVAPVANVAQAPLVDPMPVVEDAPLELSEPVVTEDVVEGAEEQPLDLTMEVRASDERRQSHTYHPEDLEEHVIPRRRTSDWSDEEEDQIGIQDPKSPIAFAEPQNAQADAPMAGKKAAPTTGKAQPKDAKQDGTKRAFDARHVM